LVEAREGARRLAVVAGSVLAAAVASLPFAGSFGERADLLDTLPGRASTAPVPAAVAASSPSEIELAAHLPAALGAPTRVSVRDTALPPPPPPPTDLDPALGIVAGDGTAVPVPVAVTPAGPPSTGVADDAPGQRVWALVIGIDDYPGTRSDLRAATADAGDLVTALLQYGVPADHIRPVYDGAASIDGVLAGLDWLVANAGPEDTAVLLYAGHVRDLGRGTEAIVTADNGWIADWFLAERLAPLAARDAWLVVAGCYGGGFDELLGAGRILTAAAGPGELAYENDGYGRSYLAEFVLRRALVEGAAGQPTVQAAVEWAMRQLAEQHPDRQIWQRDEAGHVVSLDGVRRDGSAQPGAAPEAPAPPEPAGGQLIGPLFERPCIVGLIAC